MNIEHRRFSRVDLLEVSGRVDAATAAQLKQQIEALFDEGRYRIVLDLARLEYVSSPGLRVLIEARKKAREWKITDLEGGDIRIANLPPRIKEVFDLTGFTSLFERCQSALAELSCFASPSAPTSSTGKRMWSEYVLTMRPISYSSTCRCRR